MTIMVSVGITPSHGPKLQFSDADQVRARKNHGQSLERLDERGGLTWDEAAAILEDREWHRMEMPDAKARVLEIIAERKQRSIEDVAAANAPPADAARGDPTA